MTDKKESETVEYRVRFKNDSGKPGTVMIFQQVHSRGISDVASMYVHSLTWCILSWTQKTHPDRGAVSPKYWIGFGNYEPGAGDFLEIDDMYDKQPIEFPAGVTTMNVTLNLNDSWTVL